MATEATELPQETTEPENMELEVTAGDDAGDEPNGVDKRPREEDAGDEAAAAEVENGAPKKQKTETSVEEERLDKLEDKIEEEPKEPATVAEVSVSLGPKSFGSSVEMFEYFHKLLHFWAPNLDINKYEHMVLLDLLKKGQTEPNEKIGEGIQAFQVRYHPTWKSRCFFLVRADESSDDFSFRKCVDHILPLPENMKVPSGDSKVFNGNKGGGRSGGGRGGRGGWRGGGRGRGRRGGK